MREQGSLKGKGTHRGNLCVHIFTQNPALKDILRKKSGITMDMGHHPSKAVRFFKVLCRALS